MFETVKYRLVALLLLLGIQVLGWQSCMNLSAQASLQGWGQFTLRHFTPKKWVFEGDAEFRSPFDAGGSANIITRAGVGRRFGYGFFTVGVGTVETLPLSSGDPYLNEVRIYQRLNLNHKHGRLSFSHTLRTEERWTSANPKSLFWFHLRLRYMLQAMYSFPKAKLLQGTPYLLANAEALTQPLDNFRSQIRTYAAVGVDWKQQWRMDIGILTLRNIPSMGKLPAQ
ncbi:MAG: DUF2490 domain-containing protein [Bacteroidia bacterium]